jgi:hypothetical protein
MHVNAATIAGLALATLAVPGGAHTIPSTPTTHADYINACIQGGGMGGHAPLGATTTVDVLQIQPTARFIELSVMTDRPNVTTIFWLPASGNMVTTSLFGTTTMAFSARSVKLSPSSAAATSWCVRVR